MVIVLLIVISCYAVFTYKRNLIWKDELSLWKDVVHKSPKKARGYYMLGNAYADQGNVQQAISNYNKVIEINPHLAETYNNRGIAYYNMKNYDKAWEDVHKAEGLGCAVNPEFLAALKELSGRDK